MNPRRVLLFTIAAAALNLGVLLAAAEPAAAHHCQDFTDCFASSDAASDALLGLTFLGMLSMALDFIPYVGTGKGIIEAITGRDLLTGQELSDAERFLGIIPGIGGLDEAASIFRHADEFAGAAGAAAAGGRRLGDVPPLRRPPPGGTTGVDFTDIPRIDGRLPKNSWSHGQVFNGDTWGPALQAKYPAGVRFTDQGFPDFSPYAIQTVRSDRLLTGDVTRDRRLLDLPRAPRGYIWHHVEDGVTMQLVPSDMHGAIRHTGGAAVSRVVTGNILSALSGGIG